MKNNAVTNKIRLLKEIKPNPDWLESQRRNLLLHIKSDNEAQRAWSLSEFFVSRLAGAVSKLALRPVMVSLIIFSLIFGGSFLTVKAAKNSLPGDLLYPIKIAMENVRVKISSQETRTKLQAEFVEHRAEELTQIIEEVDNPIEKKEKVIKTVNKLQAQVASTKAHLDKVKADKPEKVAEVTEAVNEKLSEAKKMVEESSESLAVILNNKKAGEEIISQMKVTETEESTEEPQEVEEPIITTPNQTTPIPININKASESME